jgi:hypothetical protein
MAEITMQDIAMKMGEIERADYIQRGIRKYDSIPERWHRFVSKMNNVPVLSRTEYIKHLEVAAKRLYRY